MTRGGGWDTIPTQVFILPLKPKSSDERMSGCEWTPIRAAPQDRCLKLGRSIGAHPTDRPSLGGG